MSGWSGRCTQHLNPSLQHGGRRSRVAQPKPRTKDEMGRETGVGKLIHGGGAKRGLWVGVGKYGRVSVRPLGREATTRWHICPRCSSDVSRQISVFLTPACFHASRDSRISILDM